MDLKFLPSRLSQREDRLADLLRRARGAEDVKTRERLMGEFFGQVAASVRELTESIRDGQVASDLRQELEGHAHLTVLVVDDRRMDRRIARAILEKDGHTVVEAGHGREVLPALEAHPVDLVLLDLVMPEMDGVQVLEVIREYCSVKGRQIGVIFLSGFLDEQEREHFRTLGVAASLSKPVDRNRLASELERLARDQRH